VSEDREIFAEAAALAAAGVPFVLVTVVRTQGSTPRDAGAKMIVRPRAKAIAEGAEEAEKGLEGGCTGTVGGGQFEELVIESAARHVKNRASGLEKFVLGAEADQCCGGVMEVFFEFVGARQRVVIFGAGHVAAALVELLNGAALEVVIVDDRADWNTVERFPRARRVMSWVEGVRAAHERGGATLACVMTCSHDTDHDLLRRLLDNPPAFVGLIGSRSKRACLLGRLVASGVDEGVIERVHCPIGVGDTGKEPRMVAISMAAQLLMEAKKLGALE